ncbi:MAG: hypothetical protein M3319_12530 [Actinomycetota bacterium]|jgi:hypothetical protein|nr:hypothetical protein [Actinomycetota bacterium]
MGKIVINAFVLLDGVIQDPDGKEGFRVGASRSPSRSRLVPVRPSST